jgi:hypothetical protein
LRSSELYNQREHAYAMTPRKAVTLALVGSFAIYFIPIVGPHAAFFVFETIKQQFRGSPTPLWATANLGVAFALQVVAFALLYWLWRRRGVLPILAVVAYGVTAIVLAQYAYMIWVPSYFLIEADTAPETGAWVETCAVADASMMTWRAPRRIPSGGWQEVWLSDSENRQAILTMPDCRRTFAPLPQPTLQPSGHADFSIGISQVVPGGLALVQRTEIPSGRASWFLLNTPTSTLLPLAAPASEKLVTPYLSDDGLATAWVLPVSGTGPPLWEELHIRPLRNDEPERVLELSRLFGVASYEPIGVDTKTGDVVLWVEVPAKLLMANLDGRFRTSPLPPGVKPLSNTVMLSDHGVIAWDAYKEDDNYQIAWATDAGTGLRRVPRGSSITAAAMDAAGRYVAFSTTTTLSIGSVRDTVVVLQTSDGREVFRRFVPRYSRTNVVFIGQGYFAYSDGGTTHVVRVPHD